jgi:Zn-dependent M28 family amino/carboxypeptidase
VRARSHGALDNASGVAAVLLAAAEADPARPLGVLLTSAEELGLAGARAWAGAWRASGRAPGVAVNCDGVDDAGRLTAMYSGARPEALARAVAGDDAGSDAGAASVRRLLPGILVDAVALADAGWRTITVSRGTLGTLGRIHTPRDTADRLVGSGIADAARLMRSLVAGVGGHGSPGGAG